MLPIITESTMFKIDVNYVIQTNSSFSINMKIMIKFMSFLVRPYLVLKI